MNICRCDVPVTVEEIAIMLDVPLPKARKFVGYRDFPLPYSSNSENQPVYKVYEVQLWARKHGLKSFKSIC